MQSIVSCNAEHSLARKKMEKDETKGGGGKQGRCEDRETERRRRADERGRVKK
jgi:hypothetical protein